MSEPMTAKLLNSSTNNKTAFFSVFLQKHTFTSDDFSLALER